MITQSKRYPAFDDTTPMPYGKHKGNPLSDVPPKYLVWLWGEIKPNSRNITKDQEHLYKESILVNVKLANYIWNSQDAIAEEIGDTFI